MLRTSILLICLAVSALADTNYFKVLIREIDNPAGTLLDGNPCSEFAFLGIGCNTYMQAAVSTSDRIISTYASQQINSHGETLVSNVNFVVTDESAADVFTGFDLNIILTADALFQNVIDNYTIHVNTTQPQGVQTYTSLRPSTLPTTVSFAWSTNIAPPSTSSTAEPTTSGIPYTGTTPTPGPTTTIPKLPVDCTEVTDKTSGVQTIYPDGVNNVSVYCDQASYGTYTVIQSRGTVGANISFDLPFANYSDLFGVAGKGTNFWLGLDNMNTLSSNGKNYSLQIDLCCGTTLVAKQIYHSFNVDTKAKHYKLTASADVPGVGLAYNSKLTDIGAPFATNATYDLPAAKDECDQFEYFDNEDHQSVPYGGWWFGSCGNNLNGFLYPSNNGNCNVTDTLFDSTRMLGVNMRTTSGQGFEGYDVDLVSYDRVRMALFTFDTALVDRTDSSFCA